MIKKKYLGLNILRFAAAVGVVAMHVLLLGGFVLPSFAHNVISKLSAFIELFFILSGFSMCCGYYTKIKHNQISVEDFYKRRFRKIVPLFMFVVTVEGILTWHYPDSPIQIFANWTMLFGLMSNNSLEVASVGWTLGVIFVFYIAFPFYVFMIGNKRRAIVSWIVSIGIHFACKYYFLAPGQYQNFTLWLFEFITGGLVFLYLDEVEKLPKTAIVVFTTICTAGVLFLEGFGYSIHELTVLLFSCWIICGIVVSNDTMSDRIVEFAGKNSFPIYLLQMLVFRALERLHLTKIFGVGGIGYIITTALTLIGCIAAAAIWDKIVSKVSLIKKVKA